jgi:hypothetical protein
MIHGRDGIGMVGASGGATDMEVEGLGSTGVEELAG